MKQPLVTLLLAAALLLTSSTHAQSWCPPGATWVYNSSGAWLQSQTQYTFVGDTVVDGFTGQHIERRSLVIPPSWDGDTMYEYTGPDIVTRTQPGLVYWWLEDVQEWDTLYWFDALPGDQWSPGWQQGSEQWGGPCDVGSYLQVLDTGVTIVDDVPLGTLTVARYIDGEAVGDGSFMIMERVGNTEGNIVPTPPSVCFVDEVGYSFSCYSDTELRYPTFSSPCELTLAVNEAGILDASNWTVSPVPFSDRFTVRSPGLQAEFTLVVLDMTGRVLQTLSFQGDVVEVDAKQLATGSYVLRMVDPRGNHSHRVVIKE